MSRFHTFLLPLCVCKIISQKLLAEFPQRLKKVNKKVKSQSLHIILLCGTETDQFRAWGSVWICSGSKVTYYTFPGNTQVLKKVIPAFIVSLWTKLFVAVVHKSQISILNAKQLDFVSHNALVFRWCIIWLKVIKCLNPAETTIIISPVFWSWTEGFLYSLRTLEEVWWNPPNTSR